MIGPQGWPISDFLLVKAHWSPPGIRIAGFAESAGSSAEATAGRQHFPLIPLYTFEWIRKAVETGTRTGT